MKIAFTRKPLLLFFFCLIVGLSMGTFGFSQLFVWSAFPAFPDTLTRVGVADYQGELWVCGGQDAGIPTAKAYYFDFIRNLTTGSWRQLPNMNTARFDAAVVRGAGDKVYVIGGNNGSNRLNTVESFDLISQTWSILAPMNTERENLGIAFVDGKLFAIGGNTNSGITNTVEIYDPLTNSWSFGAPLPVGLSHLGSCRSAYWQTIWVGGGMEIDPLSGPMPSNRAFSYSVPMNTWTVNAPLVQASFEGDIMDDRMGFLFYSGGKDFSTGYTDIYQGNAGGWSNSFLGPLPSGYTEMHTYTWVVPGGCTKLEMGYLITDGSGSAAFHHGWLTYLYILPIQELDLKAVKREESILLSWSETTQVVDGKFVVEKSTNGTEFYAISELIESESGKSSYHFHDLGRETKAVIYYRIRAIDGQGEVFYSDQVVVRQDAEVAESVWLSQNPSKKGEGKLVVDSYLAEGGYRVQILDLTGKMVWQKEFETSGDEVIHLPSEMLPASTYLIRFRGKEASKTLRWVIQ